MQHNYSRTALLCTIIVCATLLASVLLYVSHTRFSMQQSGERAYKLDRSTGEMWMIMNGKYFPVEDQ